MTYNWLPEERYQKLLSQTKMRVNGILTAAYPMHGYQLQAPEVTAVIMEIVEESWDIVRGKDKPLPTPELRRWGNPWVL